MILVHPLNKMYASVQNFVGLLLFQLWCVLWWENDSTRGFPLISEAHFTTYTQWTKRQCFCIWTNRSWCVYAFYLTLNCEEQLAKLWNSHILQYLHWNHLLYIKLLCLLLQVRPTPCWAVQSSWVWSPELFERFSIWSMQRMPVRDGTTELACHIWKFTMKRYVIFAWTV